MRYGIALVIAGAACGGEPRVVGPDVPDISATPGRAEYAFEHDGRERSFLVYVPPAHVPGRPLAIVLHGGGGNARQMFAQHPLEAEADARGIVIVAAQGTAPPGETRSFEWNGQVSLDSGVDDTGYLERVILGVTESLAIDPARRYVAGFSGGASMTVRFGAERSEHVAAIATFAGKVGLSRAGGPFVFPPTPTTPLSVQMTYGTLDPNLDGELKGDIQATSAQAGIDWWVAGLGCGAPATSMAGAVRTTTHACAAGGVVRLLVVQGMPHAWPELPDEPVAGTALVLDFFADKRKP
jgi:polyhydroxybutyrate depolymerase